MFQDILRDTPIYQYIMQEGKEEGLQEGAIAQAKKFLLRIVQKKFPELTTFATKQIVDITDVELLEDLTEDISSAQTTEDAKSLLIKVTGKL